MEVTASLHQYYKEMETLMKMVQKEEPIPDFSLLDFFISAQENINIQCEIC